MQSIIHADIFFFVTTIALIVLAAVLVIVIIYVITILNDLKKITAKFRKESEEVMDDIHNLRNHIKTEGLTMRYLSGFFKNLLKIKRK